MLFPTHLFAGYLLGRWRALPVGWVVLGAALPDLIDKPLAMIGYTELYHTAGHSALVFGGLVAIGALRGHGRTWTAIVVGWGSHLVLDTIPMVVNGRPQDVLFLLWPVVLHRPAVHLPPLEYFVYYLGTPASVIEIGIVVLFVGSLIRDADRAWLP